MSAPAFTRGPWEPRSREAFGDDETAIEAAEPQANSGRVIALCYGSDRPANARLIAAAPELYEALKACRAVLLPNADRAIAEQVDAALAKARGQ